MNKSILMSIQPQWVAKILNGEKTIEVRKKFPKDYVGWVYLYCTKGKEKLFATQWCSRSKVEYKTSKTAVVSGILNGKVVAKFWCDKVNRYDIQSPIMEQHSIYKNLEYHAELETCHNDLVDLAKVSVEELIKYLELTSDMEEATLYGINISRLKVFEKPKELEEFGYRSCNFEKCYRCEHYDNGKVVCGTIWNTITKAPQSWQFIEDTQ